MYKCSHSKKSAIELIIILSFCFVYLFYANSFESFVILLTSIVFSIALSKFCYILVPLRSSLTLASILSFLGMLFLVSSTSYSLFCLGTVLIGTGCGLAFFLLQSVIFLESLELGNLPILGVILSVSLFLSLPLSMLLFFEPLLIVIAGFLLMLISVFRLPKDFISVNSEKIPSLSVSINKPRIKISVFFFLIFLATASICLINYENELYHIGTSSLFSNFDIRLFFANLGMILGPSITALLSKLRGVYSCCILLIFAAEIAIMFTSFYEASTIAEILGYFSFGFCLTSSMVACPLMIYYLLGPDCFICNFSSASSFIPIGLLCFYPIKLLSDKPADSYQIITLSLFILVTSFFTIFSAWNHRFTLLKRQ